MSRKAWPALAGLLILGLAAAAGAATSELQRVTTLVKPAVVHIQTMFTAKVVYASEGKTQVYGPYKTGGTGSGFFINPDGFIITNGHVVEATPDLMEQFVNHFLQEMVSTYQKEAGRQFSQEEIQKLVAGIQQKGQIILIDESGTQIQSYKDVPREVNAITKAGVQAVKEVQRPFMAEVRAVSPFEEKDVAILKISGNNFPTVKLGNSDQVKLQDVITVIGYPGVVSRGFESSGAFAGDSAMEVTLNQGTVSSFKTWKDGSPILGHDAATSPGNSGGPVINSRGEGIGIHSMGARGSQGTELTGFGFMRPINLAKDFVRSAGVEPKTSLTDTRYAEAMNHFWAAEELAEAGKNSAARQEFEASKMGLKAVLDLYPPHPDAGRYVIKVEEMLSSLPKGLAIPLWVWIAIAGAVVLVVVLAVIARRPKPAAARAGSAGGAPRKGAAGPTLVAHSGPLSGNRFPIGAGLLIGRDPARCQVVYMGETVSREHARLAPEAGGLTLTNLSTTNPTYVNDQPISQALVKPGDKIRIGQVVFGIEA